VPGAIHTTRFIHSAVRDAWVVYPVPIGSRASVLFVAYASAGSSGDFMQVDIAGLVVLTLTPPAGVRDTRLSTRYVAYGGEALSVWMHGQGSVGVLTGFLFTEPATLRERIGETIDEEKPPPDLMPAPAPT
jgi:hypothetical protein